MEEHRGSPRAPGQQGLPGPGPPFRFLLHLASGFSLLSIFGPAPLSPPPTQLPEAKARMPLAPLQMLARVPGSVSEPHIVFEMYPRGHRAVVIWAVTAFWPPPGWSHRLGVADRKPRVGLPIVTSGSGRGQGSWDPGLDPAWARTVRVFTPHPDSPPVFISECL